MNKIIPILAVIGVGVAAYRMFNNTKMNNAFDYNRLRGTGMLE